MNQLTLMTRKEAQEKGLKYYFTGKPCKRGHIAERLVSTRNCLECTKGYEEGCKEYRRNYRRDNTTALKEYHRNYHKANVAAIHERQRNYRESQKLPCDLQEFYCLRLTSIDDLEKVFFKAGITTNLKKRISKIKTESNHSYLIEVVNSITLLPSECNPAVVEALFHTTTELPRYDPLSPFNGSANECYSQQPDILLHAARCLEWYAQQAKEKQANE